MTRPSGTEDDDNTSELPVIGTASVPPATHVPADWQPTERSPAPHRPLLLFAGLVVGGVVLLAIGVLAGFALSRGAPIAGAPSPAPVVQRDSPRVVAERYLSAVVAGDQVGIQADACRLLRGGTGTQESPSVVRGLPIGGLIDFEIGDERIDGRSALVDVDLRLPIVGTLKFAVRLVVEEGVWRVCGMGVR